MNAKHQIHEVTFSAGDWVYPIYFSQNSADCWETYHAAFYTEPKSSLKNAIERFKEYLRSQWNLPDTKIAATDPKPVSEEIAQQNSPAELVKRSDGAFSIG